MRVVLDNRSGEDLCLSDYELLADFVLQEEEVDPDSELSLSLVGKEEMQVLNRDYRGIDAPTDVLSFENDGELLGDVIVCPAVAREHARDFDSDFVAEMSLMLVHGILHLLGYEHDSDPDAECMEARENELLESWNVLKETGHLTTFRIVEVQSD